MPWPCTRANVAILRGPPVRLARISCMQCWCVCVVCVSICLVVEGLTIIDSKTDFRLLLLHNNNNNNTILYTIECARMQGLFSHSMNLSENECLRWLAKSNEAISDSIHTQLSKMINKNDNLLDACFFVSELGNTQWEQMWCYANCTHDAAIKCYELSSHDGDEGIIVWWLSCASARTVASDMWNRGHRQMSIRRLPLECNVPCIHAVFFVRYYCGCCCMLAMHFESFFIFSKYI